MLSQANWWKNLNFNNNNNNNNKFINIRRIIINEYLIRLLENHFIDLDGI